MHSDIWAQVRGLTDPVQRRWLIGRWRNRWPAETPPAPPAYLDNRPPAETPDLSAFADHPPTGGTADLQVPGTTVTLTAATVGDIAAKPPADPAVAAAFHAFTWSHLDDAGTALPLLWPAWLQHHGGRDRRSPAWLPAVTAERTVALLDFLRRHGMPGPRERTVAALAEHAAALTADLGDASPAALPALQGWALARLGLDCAMPATAAFGLAVLLAEARRVLRPSGIAALDSSHHHLALCRCYADAWLAARRQNRAEAAELETILRRMLGVVPLLTLRGGMPLIGDVAETLPTGWLDGLMRGSAGGQGWLGRLPAEEQAALVTLRDASLLDDLEALRADGWLRVDVGRWSGLWHAVPGGWPDADGLAHQDLGACVLHYDGVPIFVDPGGSALGEINGDGYCRLASVHGGLQLNGGDLYPANRPGYSDAFRKAFAGPPPQLVAEFDGASLTFLGLAAQSGLRHGQRRWSLADGNLVVDDQLNGTGRFLVSRRFITPFTLHQEDDRTVRLEQGDHRFRLVADQPVVIGEGQRWLGYGRAEPIHFIEVTARVNLPWRGRIRVEPA